MDVLKTNGALFTLRLRNCVILAVESRCLVGEFAQIASNNYNKLIRIADDIYLGWAGSNYAFETMKNILPLRFSQDFDYFESMDDVGNMVVEELHSAINKIRTSYVPVGNNKPLSADDFECELFLVGAIKGDNSIHTIKQGINLWKYFAIRESDEFMMKGAGEHFLPRFLEERPFHGLMTEREGVMYAFKAIEYAVQTSWACGGTIRVVAINFESDTINLHLWKQNNPDNCMDLYRYKKGKYFYEFDYNAGLEEFDDDEDSA